MPLESILAGVVAYLWSKAGLRATGSAAAAQKVAMPARRLVPPEVMLNMVEAAVAVAVIIAWGSLLSGVPRFMVRQVEGEVDMPPTRIMGQPVVPGESMLPAAVGLLALPVV